MPGESDPVVTAFVRHVLIGVETKSVKPIADKLGLSKAWVTNVREGKQAVGADSQRKIAQAYFGGSIDELTAKARAFAKKHPELVEADAPGEELEEMVRLLVEDGMPEQAARDQLKSRGFYKHGRSNAVMLLRDYGAMRRLWREGALPGEATPELGQGPGSRTVGGIHFIKVKQVKPRTKSKAPPRTR
jgi:transcriptional regulator with XRE-family HTH domain